ncbi:hypothetical protein [Neisseria montereyensis]|uniref:Cell division protein n=1 Tax=Neisseria montereyensis TaxID=2973938 RepID=A0ABT2FCC9_9NEIS|nr:hypothetical protein [Neisseria montereyensis]MCS4533862.1 hypothetical protein [Neisseria montereyensis]
MKWLFAVLVALNIIVFGATVAGRIADKQKTTVAPTIPIVAEAQQELAPPMIEVGKEASETAALDWINESESTAAVAASEPVDDELLLAEMDKKAKEEQAAKEKKEQEEKAKRERERKEAEVANRNRQCTSNASITLEEDDYHRIKGLLKQWPHVASRTVEKRSDKPKAAAQSQKTYRVLVPSGGDAMAQLDNLAAKGFSGTFYEGDISVGVTRSRSAAQVLISRLATAGFGGTRIDEQDDQSASSANNSLSVAKMQVVFMNIDDKNAASIQNIVKRYGKLSRGVCK